MTDVLKEIYDAEEMLTDEINRGVYNEDNLIAIDTKLSNLINSLEDAKSLRKTEGDSE